MSDARTRANLAQQGATHGQPTDNPDRAQQVPTGRQVLDEGPENWPKILDEGPVRAASRQRRDSVAGSSRAGR